VSERPVSETDKTKQTDMASETGPAAASGEDGERRRLPSAGELRPLVHLLPWLAPYRGRVAVAAVALVVAAGATLILGHGLRILVDRGFVADNPALLDRALLGLFGVILVLAAATFLRFYMVSWLGERLVADLRARVFSHVVGQDIAFFEVNRVSEIISRLTADTTVLQTVVGSTVSVALRNALLFVGALGMLMVTSLTLSAFVLALVPVVVAPILFLGRRVRRASRSSQDRVADVGMLADETLHAIRTVQAFPRERDATRRFAAVAEDAFRAARQRIRIRGVLTALVILLVFSGIGLILWSGGRAVLADEMTAGRLSAFIFYAVVLAGAAGALSEVVGDIQRAAGATERLFALLASQAEIAAPARPRALPAPVRGAVALEAISFAYPTRPEIRALDGVEFSVAPGERVALVGPSGAGKSTVFQLLLRFYDAGTGRVRLDGVDIAELDPADLRGQIALVPQEPVLFSGTVAENIGYGDGTAGRGAIARAAEMAHAAEFIARMPEGYDTPLGERGVRLSGGQRQRIAIARAILRDPRLLLLDEATSALDAESERLVQAALDELMAGRTTLVIAHRLATVQQADRILVLDRGRLVDSGTHGELVRAGGLYARLAELQFDPGREAGGAGGGPGLAAGAEA